MRKAKIQTMVTKQMSVTIYLTDVKKKKKTLQVILHKYI